MRTRRPNVSISDGMIDRVVGVVADTPHSERDHALRWAERRLSKSSLSQDAAAALLDGLRGQARRSLTTVPNG